MEAGLVGSVSVAVLVDPLIVEEDDLLSVAVLMGVDSSLEEPLSSLSDSVGVGSSSVLVLVDFSTVDECSVSVFFLVEVSSVGLADVSSSVGVGSSVLDLARVSVSFFVVVLVELRLVVVFVTLERVLVIFAVLVSSRTEEMTFSNPLRCNTETEDVGVAVLDLVTAFVVDLVVVEVALVVDVAVAVL